MKILLYGSHSYDQASFEKALADHPDIKIDFIKANLTSVTAVLASGYDAVCAIAHCTLDNARAFMESKNYVSGSVVCSPED